jgi:4-amino-4-deoxy-L-arabinose transferase-like glycosyltransferase
MREDLPYRRWAILIILSLTLFRFWFCTYYELIEDESYYRLWSKHLDWSYYSKGPVIAWTIFAGTSIMGDTVFGVRWISVILSGLSGWMIFRLGSRLWSERIGFWGLVVAMTLPIYAVGSVLMTIDPVSVFLWLLAAHLFLTAVEKNQIRHWIGCGFVVGLGFLAKFINALELLCFLLFLLTDPEKRGRLREKGFYAMLLTVAFCTAPVFYWNAQHGWITATHLQERGALNHRFQIRPGETLQFLYMQAVVISPLYFAAMLGTTFLSLKSFFNPAPENRGVRFASALFLPIFLFYFILSLNDNGEANWTATGFTGGILLMAHAGATWVERSSRHWKWVLIIFGFALVETILLHDVMGFGVPMKSDPAARLRGWSDLAKKVEEVRRPGDILIGGKYQTASILSFYLPDRPVTYIAKTKRIQNQFSFWPGYELTAESHGLLITDSIDEIPDALKEQFSSIEKIADFYRQDQGRDLKRYQVYRLERPIMVGPEKSEIK